MVVHVVAETLANHFPTKYRTGAVRQLSHDRHQGRGLKELVPLSNPIADIKGVKGYPGSSFSSIVEIQPVSNKMCFTHPHSVPIPVQLYAVAI